MRTFLSERAVVLTGSTVFLAKVFLEKLLWEQPDVRKVFLVIAPRGAQTAEDRLAKEIIAAPLFDRLRARHGDGAHGGQALAPEPAAGSGCLAVIRVRLPDGTLLTRRFPATATMAEVFAWLETEAALEQIAQWSLTTTMGVSVEASTRVGTKHCGASSER